MTVNEITPRDYIAEAVTGYWGERCHYHDPNCFCCKAWEAVDALAAAPASQPVAEPVVHANPGIIEMIENCTLTSNITEYAGLADHAAFEAGQDNAVECIVRMLRSAPVSAPPAEIDRLKAENDQLNGEIKWLKHDLAGCNGTAKNALANCEYWQKVATAAEARIAELEASEKRMREALEWYGEQSRLARLITSEGDPGRNAICADGGTRARAAIAK